MDLSNLIDQITEEIEAGLPKVEALSRENISDPALFDALDAQINARVADAISETVLALFKVLGEGTPRSGRVL